MNGLIQKQTFLGALNTKKIQYQIVFQTLSRKIHHIDSFFIYFQNRLKQPNSIFRFFSGKIVWVIQQAEAQWFLFLLAAKKKTHKGQSKTILIYLKPVFVALTFPLPWNSGRILNSIYDFSNERVRVTWMEIKLHDRKLRNVKEA